MILSSKAKRCQIAAVLLLIAAALVSTSCVLPPERLVPPRLFHRPAITSDGSGGIIVFYDSTAAPVTQRRFYVQRIDREGNFLWGEGVLVADGPYAGRGALQLVGDGYGGAIIVMEPTDTFTSVSPEGEIVWQREFPDGRFVSITTDGLGGAIIALMDGQRRLNIQRINAKGEFLWGEGGITLSEQPLPPLTYLDAAIIEREAIIFVWKEEDGTILAQKISLEGELLWPEGGVPVASLEALATPQGMQVVCDGAGVAIIAWIRILYETTPDGEEIQAQRIDAQRIDTEGHILWPPGGIPVFSAEAKGFLPCPFPSIGMIGSGPGEAIIVFRDRLGRYAYIYAQKIGTYGNFQWQERGVLLSKLRTFSPPRMPTMSLVSDHAGGAIVVFGYHCEEIRRTRLQAQRVDAKGSVLWQKPGVLVTPAWSTEYSSLPDGHGGVFVSWAGGGSASFSFWSYVQRITPEGKPAWGERGLRL